MNKFELKGELGFNSAEKIVIGGNRIHLLKAVKETGSISQAAKKIGMSYKAAWDAVHMMNEISEEPLVNKKTGGTGGGGAELSAYGEKLISTYDLVNDTLTAVMAEAQQNIDDLDGLLMSLRRLTVKTSVRNQYFGKVTKIELGAVNGEVTIALKGGDYVTAIITKNSVERLGVKEGMEACAMVKASSVIIADPSTKGKLSVRNFLVGKVEEIDEGPVSASVVIRLGGGSELTGVITEEALKELGIKKGSEIAGAFKASSVIIGVND
jgi:molybdate transport system regulatory protein